MTIIELFDKIARKDNDIPTKIRYQDLEFIYQFGFNYYCEEAEMDLLSYFSENGGSFNDTIEIIKDRDEMFEEINQRLDNMINELENLTYKIKDLYHNKKEIEGYEYESVIIMNPELTVAARNESIDNIKSLICNMKGTIDKIEEIGKKTLAYQIKSHNEGYYVVINFTAKPDVISYLETFYRDDNNIMKFITIRKEND